MGGARSIGGAAVSGLAGSAVASGFVRVTAVSGGAGAFPCGLAGILTLPHGGQGGYAGAVGAVHDAVIPTGDVAIVTAG